MKSSSNLSVDPYSICLLQREEPFSYSQSSSKQTQNTNLKSNPEGTSVSGRQPGGETGNFEIVRSLIRKNE